MSSMASPNEWQSILGAWIKEQSNRPGEIVLDLNKEFLLRNSLPFGAVWDLNWWRADAEQTKTWRAQGWEVSPASNVTTGKIIFKRHDGVV